MANNDYLDSYGDISVHRLMLDDQPRTEAYKKAIFSNKSLINGKTVLDVGCGTGILSVFCAQAGAKKVHAVECSPMAKLASKVVKENKFENIITVHECTVEQLELDENVDVIVSEWMGFYLLHEGMLQSVIFARDRFLHKDGVIFPESADLWVAACQLPQYFDYWKDVYGVKMESIGDAERKGRAEPVVTTINPSDILTEPSVLQSFQMKTVTLEDLQTISINMLTPATKNGRYQGICFWFVVNFPSGDEWIYLSTAPDKQDTHWHQTAVVLPTSLEVEEKQPIAFQVTLSCREDDRRKYNMEITMLDPEKEKHPTPCDCYMTKCIVIKAYLEQAMSKENDLQEEELSEDDEANVSI